MNLALLDSELFELPEMIEDKLALPQNQEVVVCAFNGRGNMLAGGTLHGPIVVWDFDVHSLARTLAMHAARVTSVQWTRSGRRILSSSIDGKLVVWDVLNGTPLSVVDMCGEVLHVALHPRQRDTCLACVGAGALGQVFLVSLKPCQSQRIMLLPEPEEANLESDGPVGSSVAKPSQRGALTAACFGCDGTIALIGTSRGVIHVLRVDNQELVTWLQLPGASTAGICTQAIPIGMYARSPHLPCDCSACLASRRRCLHQVDRTIQEWQVFRCQLIRSSDSSLLPGKCTKPTNCMDMTSHHRVVSPGYISSAAFL